MPNSPEQSIRPQVGDNCSISYRPAGPVSIIHRHIQNDLPKIPETWANMVLNGNSSRSSIRRHQAYQPVKNMHTIAIPPPILVLSHNPPNFKLSLTLQVTPILPPFTPITWLRQFLNLWTIPPVSLLSDSQWFLALLASNKTNLLEFRCSLSRWNQPYHKPSTWQYVQTATNPVERWARSWNLAKFPAKWTIGPHFAFFLSRMLWPKQQ